MQRCGSVFLCILRCGSVRFPEIGNPTVRFGAVFRFSKSYGAVRCCDTSYGAVRCGSPLNGFCYGAVPIPVGKTVQNRCFSRAHRMNIPFKTAVSCGFCPFSRGTTALTKPLQAAYELTVQNRGFVRFSCKVHIIVCFLRKVKRATTATRGRPCPWLFLRNVDHFTVNCAD